LAEAFLSVRVPAELRSRVKQLAAKRQTSVQDLVQRAIESYLLEHDRAPPDLGKTIAFLRQHAPELRKRGVEHLYVFGSLVRGEAGPDSDIDLAIDVAPDADFSLLDLVHVQQEAQDLLDRRVDVGARSSLRPSVLADFERESIRVF
jgi:predicted nucleotidyltransferase